jgi:hypothetical protein
MDKKLLKQVQTFIGMPPRAVLYNQIKQHTGASDKKLEDVLNKLWKDKAIDVWNEAWIAGRPTSEVDNLSEDDVDWLLGTGHYAQ